MRTQVYGSLDILKSMSRRGQVVVPQEARDSVEIMFAEIVNPVCMPNGVFNPTESSENLKIIMKSLDYLDILRKGGTV